MSFEETSEVRYGRTTIEYGIRRSARRKTVAIAVDPLEGVLLTAPPGVDVAQLDRVVKAKAQWIVDRLRLVGALDRGAHAAGRRLDVLLQVDLDTRSDDGATDARRGGLRPEDAEELATAVVAHDLLHLRGVMAVAPLGADPDVAFARLREVADGIRERHPGADWISAGMSGDLEAAVRHGATHLRVGTAILGSRPSLL